MHHSDEAEMKYMPWLKLPDAISVEIMSICNLQCKHCYIYNSTGSAQQLMEFNRFENICTKISNLITQVGVFNFASVEALMHPQLFKMIDLVRGINPSIHTPIYSNGMLLTDRNVSKLLDRNINEIHISLDGCRPETVEAFKTGVSFQRVTDNIRDALLLSNHKFKISSIFVIHQGNIDELPDYVNFCADMGIFSINVTGLIPYNQAMAGEALYSFEGHPYVEEMLRVAADRANQRGISFSCRHSQLKQKNYNCVTNRILYITEDGEVAPCNVLARPTTLCFQGAQGISSPISYGSVFTSSPEELWQAPAYALFRKLFHNGILPEPCRLCPMAYGVIC